MDAIKPSAFFSDGVAVYRRDGSGVAGAVTGTTPNSTQYGNFTRPRRAHALLGVLAGSDAHAQLAGGADASMALELSHEQQQVQARVDALYEQWGELEELIATPG